VSTDPTHPVPPAPPDPAAPTQSPGGGGDRRIWIVVAVVVALVALGGVIAAIALGEEDEDQPSFPIATGPTPPTGTPGPSTQPTGSTGLTGSTGSTGSANPGCSGAPAPATLADGTYFGFVESIDTGSDAMAFDLACFYTGEEANEKAAQRGDEVPVPNDVYIVNDNPATRDVPVDPATELRLVDWNACCETSPGAELDALATAIPQGDLVEIDGFRYAGSLSPYWITIEEGRVVLIEEQFLP
jgi:hypothetical protein